VIAEYRKELLGLQKKIEGLRAKKLEEEEKHLSTAK
jgi:hypothetical protein